MEKHQHAEPSFNRQAIGRRIALRRMELGLSQTALAAHMGIKQSSVSIAESEGLSTVEALDRWARWLRCDKEWLAYGPADAQESISTTEKLAEVRDELRQLEFKIEAMGWRLADAQRRADELKARIESNIQLRPPVKARSRH